VRRYVTLASPRTLAQVVACARFTQASNAFRNPDTDQLAE